jgi:NTE family protein
LRFITDLLVRRLREPRTTAASQAAKTLAIIPLGPETPSSSFVRLLQNAFESLGVKTCVADRESALRPIEWFNALEEAHGVVLYQADFEPSAWTRLCLRQADRLVFIVHASQHFVPQSALIESTLQETHRAPCDLVVLYEGERITGSGETAGLLERFEGLLAHNIRLGVSRDFRRLARLLSGRALGLVLSGGGARGFAHVGVIRALREAGIELDLFGGTSMGSIVAAGAALEWSNHELAERMRAAFSDANPVSDYTLPMIALVRGRKASRSFREHFGDRRIEDFPCPFFCVSSNLTTGRLRVHRTGLLWRALRASSSLPGVLPPVVDGSDLLIDGGILNNLPLEIMNEMHRGRVIAANVSRDWGVKTSIDDLDGPSLWQLAGHARRGTPNIFTVLMGAVTMSGMRKSRALRDSVDLLIEPAMATVGMLDWKYFDAAVEAGYRGAIDALERDWKSTVERELPPNLNSVRRS